MKKKASFIFFTVLVILHVSLMLYETVMPEECLLVAVQWHLKGRGMCFPALCCNLEGVLDWDGAFSMPNVVLYHMYFVRNYKAESCPVSLSSLCAFLQWMCMAGWPSNVAESHL